MSLGDAPDHQATLRAMAHPVRLRIMSLLTGAALTAAEVARELGLTHANASYHLRNLHSSGLITLAGEENIRGGQAKRYRYDPHREHGPSTGEDGRSLFMAVAGELTRRTAEGNWQARRSMTDAELWLDPADWLRVREQISQLAIELHLAAKPPRTPGTVRTSTTIAMFEMEADA